jgi:hypothetical protein
VSGAPLATPIAIGGFELLVDPGVPAFLGLGMASDARGFAELAIPLPATPSLSGVQFFSQFIWAETPAPCAPTGLSASRGLQVTVQP